MPTIDEVACPIAREATRGAGMTTVTRTFTSADCGICVVLQGEAHAASIFALGLVAAAKLLVEKDSTFMPPLCPGCRRIFEGDRVGERGRALRSQRRAVCPECRPRTALRLWPWPQGRLAVSYADLERLLDVAEAEGAPEEPVGIDDRPDPARSRGARRRRGVVKVRIDGAASRRSRRIDAALRVLGERGGLAGPAVPGQGRRGRMNRTTAALLALKARLRKLGEFVDLVTMRNWSPVVFRESHAWALARVAGSEAGRAPWRRGRRRR